MKILANSILIILIAAISLGKASAQQTPKDLGFFLSQAKSSSPLLKDLANQRKSLAVDSMITRATAGPKLNANGAGLYAPIVHGYGYDEVITNGQSLEGYLSLNYDLLNKKRLQNQLEGIKIQGDSIRYVGKLSTLDLERTITDQYLLTYASQEQQRFNSEVVSLLQKENELLKPLTRANVYKQSEYLTFLVTLQQQQLAEKQAEIQYRNDYATLAYMAGMQDTARARLQEPKLQDAQLLENRTFFMKKFELDSMRNDNLKKGIDLNYRPKLGVYANGGYSSSLVLQPYKNFGASAGFTFSVPIYDGHQRKMQYQKLRILGETINAYRDFFSLQQTQQLQLIRQQISYTNGLFKKINEQIKFSRALIEVDSRLLHTGDLRIVDFIIAINNYMSAQNLYRQTMINKLKLINQYNYWNK